MRRIVAVIVAVALLLGVVACTGLNIGSYFGAIPLLAAEMVVPSEYMAVFYWGENETAVFWCTNAVIDEVEIDGEPMYDITSPQITTTVSMLTMCYGIYEYKELPDLSAGTYYLDDLELTPVAIDELPWSDHIARLRAVNPSRVKPVQVRRFYKGETYDIWCLVRQNVVNEWIAGDLEIGDWVTVSYIEEMPNATEYHVAVVTGKIYESWS